MRLNGTLARSYVDGQVVVVARRVHSVPIKEYRTSEKALQALSGTNLFAFNYNRNITNGGVPQGIRMTATHSDGVNIIRQTGPDAQGFRCGHCSGSYTTKIGLGQHMRQTHPLEYHARLEKPPTSTSRAKRMWSNEERVTLALKEVEARTNGFEGSIDRHLAARFLSRTFQAIRGQRRQPAYLEIYGDIWRARGGSNQTILSTPASQAEQISPSAIVDDASPGGAIENSDEPYTETLRNSIKAAIPGLKRLRKYHAGMLAKAAETSLRSRNGRTCRVMEWLKLVLTSNSRSQGGANRGMNVNSGTNSGQRKTGEYAILQKLYKRGTKWAARHVFEGVKKTLGPTPSDHFDFWKSIYTRSQSTRGQRFTPHNNNMPTSDLWAPITEDDIKASEPNRSAAPGIDGITAQEWRQIPRKLRATFYNLLMLRGEVDQEFLRARTVFIPKVEDPKTPGEFRPISIASILIRQFHRIFARRLQSFRPFDERQRAFCPADGTAENLLLLKSILEDAQSEKKELHIVSIDIKKAFDSVTHSSVFNALGRIGCPVPFVNYIQGIYAKASTVLQYQGESVVTDINSGVPQGDPLSPLCFNHVMDGVVGSLNGDVGYSLKGKRINCIAFADDLMFIAESAEGMQYNLDQAAVAMTDLSFEVNTNKSFGLSLLYDGKEKKMYIPTRQQFAVNGAYLKQIDAKDTWSYLGVQFEGVKVKGIKSDLIKNLSKLEKAPLKPQQKYTLFRLHLITKYYHQMILGSLSATALSIMDGIIRHSVRGWFKFPNDSPIAYFYARVKSGGLSIPCLSLDVFRWRLSRMERFIKTESEVAIALSKTAYYTRAKLECENALCIIDSASFEKDDVIKYWETKLEEKIDTKDLTQCKNCSESTSYLWSKSRQISGREYIRFQRIRLGTLPSLERRARGRDKEHKCRAGCNQSETNYHVIQQCKRSHGGRVLRHNNLLDILVEELSTNTGLLVNREARFDTRDGLRIPDLILTDGPNAMVIDVHIVRGEDMAKARRDKIDKYQRIKDLSDLIKQKYWCSEVFYEALTMSYKGIFERASAELLKRLNVRKQTLFRMSTAVLRGSWLNWNSFNREHWAGAA